MCEMFIELVLLIITLYIFLVLLMSQLSFKYHEIVKVLIAFTSFWLLMVTISTVAVFVFYVITLFYI